MTVIKVFEDPYLDNSEQEAEMATIGRSLCIRVIAAIAIVLGSLGAYISMKHQLPVGMSRFRYLRQTA